MVKSFKLNFHCEGFVFFSWSLHFAVVSDNTVNRMNDKVKPDNFNGITHSYYPLTMPHFGWLILSNFTIYDRNFSSACSD